MDTLPVSYPCLPASYPCVKNISKTMLASVGYPTGPIQDIGHLRIARPDGGSDSDIATSAREVRSALRSGHRRPAPACPFRAISGLMHRSKGLFDDLARQREQH